MLAPIRKKCEDRFYDLYVLASHEMRCRGEDRDRRFDGCFRVEFEAASTPDLEVVVSARSSSH
jgi:hypothetical protein